MEIRFSRSRQLPLVPDPFNSMIGSDHRIQVFSLGVRFFYLLPAYNEAQSVSVATRIILDRLKPFVGSRIFWIENGSTDNTWAVLQGLSKRETSDSVQVIQSGRKGYGAAARLGFRTLIKEGIQGHEDWVVLSAADLPFRFSDLDAFQALHSQGGAGVDLVIGSKTHEASQITYPLFR